MDPGLIVLVVGGVGLVVGLFVVPAVFERQARKRLLREAEQAIAQRGLEAVLADIVRKREQLAEEERILKANAGLVSAGGGLAGAQTTLHQQMMELDDYEALVRGIAVRP